VFFLFGFYAWQRYMLDLLGLELVWVSGVVQAAFSVMMILGNGLVKPIAGQGEHRRSAASILTKGAIVSSVLAMVIGLIGFVAKSPGWGPFAAATTAWLGFGLVFGVMGPVAQAFINEHIPSAQRATVLSLQAFFSDIGAAFGQPALGFVAERASIALAFVLGGGVLALTAPLYASAGRAVDAEGEAEPV